MMSFVVPTEKMKKGECTQQIRACVLSAWQKCVKYRLLLKKSLLTLVIIHRLTKNGREYFCVRFIVDESLLHQTNSSCIRFVSAQHPTPYLQGPVAADQTHGWTASTPHLSRTRAITKC